MYIWPELIIQETLPGSIHQPGSVVLRHLGEIPSEAQYKPIGIYKRRQRILDWLAEMQETEKLNARANIVVTLTTIGYALGYVTIQHRYLHFENCLILCSRIKSIVLLLSPCQQVLYCARRGSLSGCLSSFQLSPDLNDPQHVQNDEDEGNNDQSVNPIACFREAWTYVPTQKAEQPQDY